MKKFSIVTVKKFFLPLERREFLRKIFGVTLAAASIYFLSLANSISYSETDLRRLQLKKYGPNPRIHRKPGELDNYYGFWSGGPSGEIRILAIPTMRELKRVPVFNFNPGYGHGVTLHSKRLLGSFSIGDTHHVHLSYNDGTYDGRFAFVNDKANARLARIRLDYMEVDSIVSIPNSQGTHGIFPSRHKLDGVYCNAEFRTPYPYDSESAVDENPKNYVALHTCVDAASMLIRWQIKVRGNLDLCATDYKGKYSLATCYNSEEGVTLNEMIAADRDWVVVFNLERIEQDVKDGKGESKMSVVRDFKGDKEIYFYHVLDGRIPKNPYVLYIPIPKNPHGVNVEPKGRYAICCGKISPTVSILSFEKIDEAFAGKLNDPRECVVAEPEIGLGPLHTAFDKDGNAYTSLFIDSMVCKWNIEKAIKGLNPIITKLDIHYQVGHINGTMSETKEVETKYIFSLNKFSKDRFLPVGPFFPENDQLICIDARGKLLLAHDEPAAPEPHDAVIVRRDIIKTKQIWDMSDRKFRLERYLASKLNVKLGTDAIIRQQNRVFVFITSVAPNYGFNKIEVVKGNHVFIIQTNLDNVADTCHGFCLSSYNINFGISPLETVSASFYATIAGVFWYYCPWFCHALHLEMRGRLLVR